MTSSTTSRRVAHCARPLLFPVTLFAAFALLGLCSKQATATIHFVSTTGSSSNTGLSWSSPKSDLQATIHAAVSGDQVWVKHGIYAETNNFTATDGVAVYGHFAGTETSIHSRQLTNTAYTTTLNATSGSTGPVYAILNTATRTNTLDGFTIENTVSNQSNAGLEDNSSGDSLKVENCTFTAAASSSSISGGLAASSKSTTISDCVFSNIVDGAISADGTTTTITGCTFTNNSAGVGGAVSASGTTTTITGCTFTSNSGDGGGAVYAGSSTMTIKGCTFKSNTAADGGGVFAGGTPVIIEDCTFGGSGTSDANTPQAVYLENAGGTSTNPITPAIVKDNLIIGAGTTTTDPDGIDMDLGISGDTSYATIANNTIVNTNVGINIATSSGAISVANNIFYGDYGSLNDTGSPTFTSSHNDNDNNVSYYYHGVKPNSSDLLSVNPMFVNAGSGNYRLSTSSPLINAGDNSYVTTGDTDLDGNPRIHGSAVDIGAYEFYPAPTIASFSPTSGPIGTVVTIVGTNLNGVTAVRFHNANATVFSANAAGTQLTVTVPTGAGTGTFTVTTPGGSIKTTGTFTVN